MYRVFVLTAVLFLFAGCSYYSVSGSLPGYIKTAAVPLFENRTVEPGIIEDLTDAIEAAIIRDGNMKITGEFQADAVVQGVIIDVIDEADIFSKDENAKQFRIRIFADVQFYDRVKNKVIWEAKKMEGWARYDASGSSASASGVSRDTAKSEALKMLAEKIIDNTVAGW